MLIVVTGSSGRLGRAVVRDLLDNGHDVRPLDITDGDPALPPTRKIDLTRIDDVASAIAGAGAIAHLGNRPYISPETSSAGFTNNLQGTFNVFHAAEAAGIRRVVYASSLQSYGCFRNHSSEIVAAPRYFPIDEDHPLQACHPYSMSKAMGETIAESYARRRPELCAFSLRFTLIHFGFAAPGANHAAPLFLSLCTFIHVADAARSVRLACESDRRGHTPLNILSPEVRHPWSESAIVESYGHVPEFRRSIPTTQPLACPQRARSSLGFTAEMPLHQPQTPAFQNR
jgi:nucleoside-diphosphate-sugar epimerase